jgi:Flp pilus assembly protein TadD
LRKDFSDEIRIYNNLGIIHKRNGNVEAAQSNYDIALNIDAESFFPNYNMGVLKA